MFAAEAHAPTSASRATDRTLAIPSGSLRIRSHGSETTPLALGVPGLSANALSFEALGRSISSSNRRLVAIDLRGRGRSLAGAPGTHGWENHARDVIAVADALGAKRFDFIGHSMGAFVGLVLANLAPERLRRLVLIDAVGVPDPRAMPPIFAAAQRIGELHPSVDAFLDKVRAANIVPIDGLWEAHYREDLVQVPGGVQQRSSYAAVMEDVAYASISQVRNLWPGVGCATLLVRASRPLTTPGSDIVPPRDRDDFIAKARRARTVEVDANHYGVMSHTDTASAIEGFLR